MLPNEVFALACRAYYEEGLIVDERNGEFAHCPYPEDMGETGYYLLHEHHQQQGLLQSKDVGKCCFFVGHAKKWLSECNYFSHNYFELWDIYDEYAGENGRKMGLLFRDEGKGIFDPLKKEKVVEGAVKSGRQAVKNKTGIHNPENEEIRLSASLYARDNNVGIYDPKHRGRVEQNRTENGLKAVANRTGIFDPSYEKKHSEVGRDSGSQKWVSTIDGYTSNAPRVASHNKSNGWDPNARVRIS